MSLPPKTLRDFPPVLSRFRAGVKILTPGTRGRRTGESKISACSSGTGAGGLESGESGSLA